MSDSDSNQGEAEYSDDSDYENGEQSFISGRRSKMIDESIAQETVEFKDVPKVENQHKESLYSKKKKEAEREEQHSLEPQTNQEDQPANMEHTFKNSPQNHIHHQYPPQCTTELKAHVGEEQRNEGRQIGLDEIVNDEQNGDAVYSDDEEREAHLDRESYMSTAPQHIQFSTQPSQAQQSISMPRQKEQPPHSGNQKQQRLEENHQQVSSSQVPATIIQQHHPSERRPQREQPSNTMLTKQAEVIGQKVEEEEVKVEQSTAIVEPISYEQASQQQQRISAQQLKLENQQRQGQLEGNHIGKEPINSDQGEKPADIQVLHPNQIEEHTQIHKQASSEQVPAVDSGQINESQRPQEQDQQRQAGQMIVVERKQEYVSKIQESGMISNQQEHHQHPQPQIKIQEKSAPPANESPRLPANIQEKRHIQRQLNHSQIKAEKGEEQIKQSYQPSLLESEYSQKSQPLNLMANLKVVPTQSQFSEMEPQRKMFQQKRSEASVIMISRKAEKEYVAIEPSSNQSYANLSNDLPRELSLNPPRTKTKPVSQIKQQKAGGESQACKCQIM